MATTGIEKELYSFSTEDGKAIPLDIIRPLSLIRKTFLAVGVGSFTIPANWKIASFYSNVGCFIQFAAAVIPNPPIDDTEYADVLWVPPNFVVTATVVVGAARIIPAEQVAGYVVAQQIQKWAGLALKRQTTKVSA